MSNNGEAKPYIIGQTLGAPLADYADQLPQKNSDGQPGRVPTPEQKYRFDKDGWRLVPGVLEQHEIDEMRDFSTQLHFEPESLPEDQRSVLAGPTQRLSDHPLVIGMLNEFMANPSLSSPQCYGYSLGGAGLWYRTAPARRNEGNAEERPFAPHNGNGLHRFPGDLHFYTAFPGKAYSPHTRVVWELNPVSHGHGGTLLVTGSHKAAYTAPDEIGDPASSMWTTYTCPAGSVLFFTEALTHSAHPWTNEENDRIAVAHLYNPVDGGHAPMCRPDPRLLEAMPPLRQTLFRERYAARNVVE